MGLAKGFHMVDATLQVFVVVEPLDYIVGTSSIGQGPTQRHDRYMLKHSVFGWA